MRQPACAETLAEAEEVASPQRAVLAMPGFPAGLAIQRCPKKLSGVKSKLVS